MRIRIILLILIFSSCRNTEFVPIEFQIRNPTFETQPYKFSSDIKTKTLKERGEETAAVEYSIIGDIKQSHKTWATVYNNRGHESHIEVDSFKQLKRTDAIPYIVDRAHEHQIIVINEAHHMPQHRVFLTQLLDELKNQGYKHLGLEAYWPHTKSDTVLSKQGYPDMTIGYYTKEPQLGNLIRNALGLGYGVFGYDGGAAIPKAREIFAAKNIEKYMERFPNEKIIIQCGYDHVYEGDMGPEWEKSMTGRLKEYTALNPLTINLERYSERSKKELENVHYAQTNLNNYSVYVDDSGNSFGEYPKGTWADIAVFSPRSGNNVRANWLLYDNRKIVELEFESIDIECPCMVLAYVKGEEIGYAIPYDIQEVNEKKVSLVLDESDFEVIFWNQNNVAYKTEINNRY